MQEDSQRSPTFWRVWRCLLKSIRCISAGGLLYSSKQGWAMQNNELPDSSRGICTASLSAVGWAVSLHFILVLHTYFFDCYYNDNFYWEALWWFSLPVSDCRAGFWQCSDWRFSYLFIISFSYCESRNASFSWSVRQKDLQQSQSWKLF